MKFEPASLGDFINEIFVVCPKCHAKGTVTSTYQKIHTASFSCPSCTSSKVWDGDPCSFVTAYTNYDQYEGILFGPPVDCFFRYPLWYQASCKNEVLYAYNLAHLHWLKVYIGSKLRERSQNAAGWSNGSLQSRLPKWMLSVKNRATVLKKLVELERK